MYTIYTKNDCPYCTWAKDLLKSQSEIYEELNVQQDQQFLDQLTERLGFKPKTVPQIWNNDLYIGGYDQLVEYLGMK